MGKKLDLDDKISQAGEEMPIKEGTELGEVFGNLDSDNVNTEKMSNIDFNARLTNLEATNCIVFDEMKALGILPANANLTRLKKRVSVSLDGLGRQEKVQIASASRGGDLENRQGIGGFFKKMFSKRGDSI